MKHIQINDIAPDKVANLHIEDNTLSVEGVLCALNQIIDNAFMDGENGDKAFSIEDDGHGDLKWVIATSSKDVDSYYDNVSYFIIPSEKLTKCGLVQMSFFAGESVSCTDPVQLVLWDYDNSGTLDNNSVKYLGFSDNSLTLSVLTLHTFQFTNNPYGAQIKSGHSVIVQATPDSVTPDKTWKWEEKSELYNVMSLATCHDKNAKSVIHINGEDKSNTFPIINVLAFVHQRIEVSKGGISTTYGTDTSIAAVDASFKVNGAGIGSIILQDVDADISDIKDIIDDGDKRTLSAAKEYADKLSCNATTVYVKDPADQQLSSGEDVAELSVIKVPKDEFEYYVANDVKMPSPILWVVSSDVIDAYDEPVLNVEMSSYPGHSSEATNKEYVDNMLSAKATINNDNEVVNVYGIQLHDVNAPEKVYKLYIQDGIIKLDKNF